MTQSSVTSNATSSSSSNNVSSSKNGSTSALYTGTPKLLLILDGFGIREERDSNAIAQANTPHFDKLWSDTGHRCLISASGLDVGLPGSQMGNSEVGHMNIGSGRVLYQDLTRISKAIQDGEFNQNQALLKSMSTAVKERKAIHLFGLLSSGGVHSHEDHILALTTMAHSLGATQVYIHAFLDGRDTPPKSAAASIEKLEKHIQQLNNEAQSFAIATICGRFYAMDRDKRWDRVEAAYKAIALGETVFEAETAIQGLDAAYAREETDEFVSTTKVLESYKGIQDGDVAVFANYRSDRAKEIGAALFNQEFNGFPREDAPKLSAKVTMTHYSDDIEASVAFSNDIPKQTLGEIISSRNLRQLRLAETEKYAHVTFFMNAGRDEPWPLEERILIPSPSVRTYDEAPAMSLPAVTDKLCDAIENQTHELIICNFANADMVGHTGNFDAAVEAIEAIDISLGRVIASLAKVQGEALITADHGNAEQMLDAKTGQAHTAHTSELVPLIYIGPQKIKWRDISQPRLSDLAPTILALMNIPQPKEMTGRCLLDV